VFLSAALLSCLNVLGSVLVNFVALGSILASIFLRISPLLVRVLCESTLDFTSILERITLLLLSILLTDASRCVFFAALSDVLVVEGSLVRCRDLLRDAAAETDFALFISAISLTEPGRGDAVAVAGAWHTGVLRNSRLRHFSRPSRILCWGALPGKSRRVTSWLGSAGCQTSRAHTDTRSSRGI